MPMPNGPVFLVGECGEAFARVNRVRVPHSAEKVAIQERICIRVTFAQFEPPVSRQVLEGARFCWA